MREMFGARNPLTILHFQYYPQDRDGISGYPETAHVCWDQYYIVRCLVYWWSLGYWSLDGWVIYSSQGWEEYWLHEWIKALKLFMNNWEVQGRDFAVATSLGALYEEERDTEGCRKTSLTLISKQTLLRVCPLITVRVHIPFYSYQGWGALTKARDCIFIRDISNQGSMFRVSYRLLLSWKPIKSWAPHDLIRDKISSFVCASRIWHDGTAGIGHLGFSCLGNWYIRGVVRVLGPMVCFLYWRFWWSWIHFTGEPLETIQLRTVLGNSLA